MPWDVSQVDEFTKGLDDKQKAAWVKIANGVLAKCEKDDGKDCEAMAIRVASAMSKNVTETGDTDWLALANLEEAVTIKAQAKSMMRQMDMMLKDKALPAAVKNAMDALHSALTRTWSDLEDEATNGPKPREFPIKKEAPMMTEETAKPDVVQPP
ncbi:MAG: hypothetical protein Q7J80_06890, partial [Anaerolineales bacterium]|nr:hypothetical protein [Anaerolineales bacterium]